MSRDYLANPNFCPVCGYDEVTAGQFYFSPSGEEGAQDIYCDHCDAKWHDLWSMTGYELLDEDGERGTPVRLVEPA